MSSSLSLARFIWRRRGGEGGIEHALPLTGHLSPSQATNTRNSSTCKRDFVDVHAAGCAWSLENMWPCVFLLSQEGTSAGLRSKICCTRLSIQSPPRTAWCTNHAMRAHSHMYNHGMRACVECMHKHTHNGSSEHISCATAHQLRGTTRSHQCSPSCSHRRTA